MHLEFKTTKEVLTLWMIGQMHQTLNYANNAGYACSIYRILFWNRNNKRKIVEVIEVGNCNKKYPIKRYSIT